MHERELHGEGVKRLSDSVSLRRPANLGGVTSVSEVELYFLLAIQR